jgi:hypothetical protein
MRALLTAFFALIFSFGHAHSLRSTQMLSAGDQPTATAPTREELALNGCVNGYAGSACRSQPMTSASWNALSNTHERQPGSPRPILLSAAFSHAEK